MAKIATAAITTDAITIPAIPPDDRPKIDLNNCYIDVHRNSL